MRQRHRHARDAHAPRLREIEHLEVEAETVQAARREELPGHVGAKSFQAALRVGDAVDEEDADEDRQRAPGEVPSPPAAPPPPSRCFAAVG